MVPGLLCFLKLEETHSRVHLRFPLPLPRPCPSAVDGFSRFLLSLTASLLFVSPSHLLPHSPREGSYSQLPWGGWRAPPRYPCVPATVPLGGLLRPLAQKQHECPPSILEGRVERS